MIRTLCITAFLFASACSQPAAEAPATPPTLTSTEAKPSDVAAPQAGEAPTAQMLIGRWGDNGDCSKDIVFSADGTFRSYTGGGGSWSLSGDIMTMSGQGGVFQVRVSILNGNQLLIGNPDGTIGVSQRC